MQQTQTLKSIWQAYRQGGGPDAKEQLILNCMPLVRHVVNRLATQLPPHLDREDLLEAGVYGMVDAIERYNPREDAKFETYAVLRIRGAVIDELRARDFVPRSLRKKARQIREARAALIADNDYAPTAAELAEALNLNEDDVNNAIAEVESIASITSLYDQRNSSDPGESFRMVDVIPDPRSISPSQSIETQEKKEALATAIQSLPEQERLVITLYYYEDMLLKQIGELFGVSESRISQIRSRALMLLKLKMKPSV
ncbi:MAG: FliA/WhiG family RNA polymerase sigma factor [Planctomycetes bacterium]|nr:FliA/WhiG family RNA polymerase sigma factor [Planctomycetota bacterium]